MLNSIVFICTRVCPHPAEIKTTSLAPLGVSKGDRVEDLEVDKLDADVANGGEQQVTADEDIERLDEQAHALAQLAYRAQGPPQPELRQLGGLVLRDGRG